MQQIQMAMINQYTYKTFESELIDDLWCVRILPADNVFCLQFCGVNKKPSKKEGKNSKTIKSLYWSVTIPEIDFKVALLARYVWRTKMLYRDVLPFDEFLNWKKLTIHIQMNIGVKEFERTPNRAMNDFEYKL